MLLAELKAALKQRIAEGANYAIKQLEEVLRPDSDKFNKFVQIKGRYNAYLNAIVSGMASKAELDGQYNQISTALLYFTDSLRDEYLRTEQPAPSPAQTKRGELLYHFPHEMQTAHEYKCAVRVAYLRALLYDDWQRYDDDVQKSIPVAEIMSVELLNQDGSEPFEIRSFSDTIQFLDQDFHTEWEFYVKPRRLGAFPLLLKISVVETRNGRDVKRNIVLEERVVVSTDAPLEVETNFQKSDIRLDLSSKEQGANSKRQKANSHEQAAEAIAKEGPTVNPSNSNRPLATSVQPTTNPKRNAARERLRRDMCCLQVSDLRVKQQAAGGTSRRLADGAYRVADPHEHPRSLGKPNIEGERGHTLTSRVQRFRCCDKTDHLPFG